MEKANAKEGHHPQKRNNRKDEDGGDGVLSCYGPFKVSTLSHTSSVWMDKLTLIAHQMVIILRKIRNLFLKYIKYLKYFYVSLKKFFKIRYFNL